MSKIQDFVTAFNNGGQARLDAAIAKFDNYKSARAIAITLPGQRLLTKAWDDGPVNWPEKSPGVVDNSIITVGNLFNYVYPIEGGRNLLPNDGNNIINGGISFNLLVTKELEDNIYGSASLNRTLKNNSRSVDTIKEYEKLRPFDGQEWFDRFMFDFNQTIKSKRNDKADENKYPVEQWFIEEFTFSDYYDFFKQNYYSTNTNSSDLYESLELLTKTQTDGQSLKILYDAIIEAGLEYKLAVPSASNIVTQSGTQSGTYSTNFTGDSPTFYISVKDPKSDTDKKITGTIDFQIENKNGLNYIRATAIVKNLPIPFTNPKTKDVFNGFEGQRSCRYKTEYLPLTKEVVADYSIYGLQTKFNHLFGVPIVLQYTDIAPDILPDPVILAPTQSGTQSTYSPTQSVATASSIFDATGIKVTIAKKSGPGELIGEVEQIVKNGFVDFGGIQFDAPGDYILTVTPDSTKVETQEITIKVQPEDEVIAQDKTRGDDKDDKKVDGTRPIIAQIDKPTIVLKPMEYKTTDSNVDNKEVVGGLGFTPFLWYNAYQISAKDIKSMELFYEGLVPQASVSFADTMGIMKKEGFPLDDTKFEIFLNSGSKNIKSIHLKFKLLSLVENKNGSYTAKGTLDLTDFYKIRFKSYKGTSFEVLRDISKELQIGYNSNITNTVDSMTWLNNGKIFKDFINTIIEHSYISETSYVLGYIDYYYCFNYVDIEKEWLRDTSNDVGIVSGGTNFHSGADDSEKIQKLMLTNDKSMNSTNFFFSNYKLNNQSTKVSVNKGHFTVSKAYDSITKQFLVFNIDSQTSDGSKTHILKGAPGDGKDITDNFSTKYSGKMDTTNVHKNYYYSEGQNRVNLDNMIRISVDLELPNANFNLYKFMKINMNFVNEKPNITAGEVQNSRLNGEWIIIDIGYKWNSGNLRQTVKCVKKELGKTPEEIKNDAASAPVKQPEVNTQNNENPEVPADPRPTFKSKATPPNSVYKVGEVYLVQTDAGKQYTLTITEVSENGIEVKGKIKNI